MHRRLPPLPALRAFEAAGRLLSFSRAADELALTQSAVSHHIRKLEAELKVKLFLRKTRAVELTTEGARYLDTVRQAFDLLADGTRDIRAGNERTVLQVSLLASFATHWLAPRLGDFSREHPDIDLQLNTSIAHADLAHGEADVAIRYGQGGWPEVDARLLMPERLSPVCSPALLAQRSRPGLKALADFPLLLSHARTQFEWRLWSEAAHVDISENRSVMLHDYNIVLQAAAAGQGVAIGRLGLIADKLRSGELVPMFPEHIFSPPQLGYWLLTAPGEPSAAASAFVNWIVTASHA